MDSRADGDRGRTPLAASREPEFRVMQPPPDGTAALLNFLINGEFRVWLGD